MKTRLFSLLILLLAVLMPTKSWAQEQVPAFPGAEGHGRYVTGGRGGTVVHVTNLNDNGTGSFRAAVTGGNNRIIVFDVAGVIPLNTDISFKDNITICGETAPYPGITLRYYTVRPGANNIIRFIRFRRGQEKDVNDGGDATWQRNKTGIILDHCSFSWSIDEVASFYDNNNFTMQWCTIGESLVNAGHDKGAHGYGGIWGGKLASFHHNLILHVANRSPRFNGARYNWTGYTGNKLYSQYNWQNAVQAENVDFRNCVVYNTNGCYGGPGGGQINMVGNYYKSGPAARIDRLTAVSIGNSGNASGYDIYWGMTSRYYLDGNKIDGSDANWEKIKYDEDIPQSNGIYYTQDPNHYYGDDLTYTKVDSIDCLPIQLEKPAPVGEITTHSATTAFNKVLKYAGASLYRDEVDERYANEAENGTATYLGSVTKKYGLIDIVADCEGYTEENFPTGSRPADFDTDEDGIPDEWELANGLNPNDKSDAAKKTIDTERGWYTNLEVYLSSLVEDIMRFGNGDAMDTFEDYYPTYKSVSTVVDEPYAVLSADSLTVTFYYDDQKAARGGMDINNSDIDYNSSSPYGSATTAVIDASFADYRPTSTAYWFEKCSSLTSITGMENLKTENVTDMISMFEGCSNLTSLDLSGFNTQNVREMRFIFAGCSALTGLDLSGFDTQNVKYMTQMFARCSGLTSLDLSGFDTQNVMYMSEMFVGCSSLTSLDVSHFDTQNVTGMSQMFYGCSGLTSLDVSHFNTQNVTSMGSMFAGCSALTSLDLSGFDTQNVTSMRAMFYNCTSLTQLNISHFDTHSVTDMSYMFLECSNLTSLDVSSFNTSNVTTMRSMFAGLSGLQELNVRNFDTGKVTDMRTMFSNCSGLTILDVSNFNTENVTGFGGMFQVCSNLTSLDLSNFNTSKAFGMGWMFAQDTSLTNLNISSFDTRGVGEMNAMFLMCTSLPELNISHFNTANVTTMNMMFYQTNFSKLDLSSFNTANVKDMDGMFGECPELTSVYVGSDWSTQSVEVGDSVFFNSPKLIGGMGTIYNADNISYTYARIDGGPSNPGYFTAIADTAVAEVVFNRNMNELTLQCATPNTTIWYSISSGTSDARPVSIAEFNAAEVSTDVWYQLTGTVKNLKDGDQYGNFDLEDATGSVYVYGLLSEKGGEKKKFQELMAAKGIANGSTITIIGTRGEYSGKVEVTKAYYVDNEGENGNEQWQQYTAPLALSENCIVKAYAELPTGARSKVSSYAFTVIELPKVETPSFSWDGEKLAIGSATEGATISYSVKEYSLEATGEGTQASPYNVTALLQTLRYLPADAVVASKSYVRGVVSRVQGEYDTKYGNASFYISDDGTQKNEFYGFRLRYLNGMRYDEGERQVKVGDEVVIYCDSVVYYRGNTYETYPNRSTLYGYEQDTNASYLYDFTTPEFNNLYEGPISVADNVIVRAKATKQGMADSDMAMLTIGGPEPYAVLAGDSISGMTLTFYYDKHKADRNGMDVGPFEVTNYDDYELVNSGWDKYRDYITTVVFDDSFAACETIYSTTAWFYGFSKLTTITNIRNLKTDNVYSMGDMFWGCESLETIDVSGFNTSNVWDFGGMFGYCFSLKSLDVSSLNTSSSTWMRRMFSGCYNLTSLDVSKFKTDNVTNMVGMFENCSGLTGLDVSGFKTDSVTSMLSMFYGCSGLEKLDVSRFNTENVTSMWGMFSGCSSLTSLDVSHFDTKNVTSMTRMFDGCSSLTTLDVSHFNTDSLTAIGGMFRGCSALTSLEVGRFNTSKVVYMWSTFLGCTNLKRVDVSGFKTDNVIDMTSMFGRCESLTTLDLSSFNTAKVTSMQYMFRQDLQLKTIYVGDEWSTVSIEQGDSIFYASFNLVGGKGTAYDVNHVDYTYARIDGGPDTPGYFTRSGDEPYVPVDATFDSNGVLAVGGTTTMADALSAVGGRDEVAKRITAIVWNRTATLTNNDLQGLDNPNMLVYVQSGSLAPDNRDNVVIGNDSIGYTAKNIVLTDTKEGNNNFYCPQAFTAEMISYTRNFQQRTEVGVSRGWETIALPFTVQTVTHEKQQTIAPFGSNASTKHFWLRKLGGNGLTQATKIEANEPYLISMPNNPEAYYADYNLSGKVTFTSQDVTVPVTAPVMFAKVDYSVLMVPAFQSIGRASDIWALNVGQSRDEYFEGSVFERDYREVRPFEAYTVHNSNSPAPRFMPIKDLGGATGIDELQLDSQKSDLWYDLNGRKLQQKPTQKGVYLNNGYKVVIK